MSKSSTTLFTEPTESHVRTERRIGIYLRDHCPGLSISDFTDAKKDRSTYREMAAAYKLLVKAYAPKREPNEKGRLIFLKASVSLIKSDVNGDVPTV
jgi:hypothetical protein